MWGSLVRAESVGGGGWTRGTVDAEAAIASGTVDAYGGGGVPDPDPELDADG